MKPRICLLMIIGLLAGLHHAAGQSWVSAGLPNENWNCVHSSADGSKLAAVGLPGLIYISTNSGANWIQAEATNADWPMQEDWQAVAGSADGIKLVVVGQYDSDSACPVFTSTNSGLNWTASPYLSVHWTSIASSADGTKLVAGADGDSIYTSTNSGITWTATQTLQGRWSCVASSADGSKLIASLYEIPGDGYGAIYTSTNSGSSWTQITNLPPQELWTSVSSSADGTKLVAVNEDRIYFSTDSGTTWTGSAFQYAGGLSSIASSADGTKLVVGIGEYKIYASINSGLNWTNTGSVVGNMWSVASSADGSKLLAADGLVYTLYSIPAPQMSITPAPNSLKLSWIIPSTNFVMQQSSDLVSWSNVTNAPALNLTNLQNEMILSPPNSSGFYRLKTP